DARRVDGTSANDARAQALTQTEPVRFHALLSGAYTPCWASAVYGSAGAVYTMIGIDRPDWTALTELMSTFRNEASLAINSTAGHADLIKQLLATAPKGASAEQLSKRVGGFASIIATHMHRLQMLMELLHRLEVIRTGQLLADVRKNRRKIIVKDFLEDFLEEQGDLALFDPGKEEDLHDRLKVQVPGSLVIGAPAGYLKSILRDLLRNAIMYSPAGSPIRIKATSTQQGNTVQIDVIDQGYGIRVKEADRIFAPFQRARQPQVIAEFGYGLSLSLAKSEIEAMGGRIWYESEEGVGSTFSLKLPAWHDFDHMDSQEN
ncbi:MAG TPA: ATP-binding protein, partial [Aggregatilineales bacterium]|nr:ATP-binding protein [Aggregatilineales bacterium]